MRGLGLALAVTLLTSLGVRAQGCPRGELAEHMAWCYKREDRGFRQRGLDMLGRWARRDWITMAAIYRTCQDHNGLAKHLLEYNNDGLFTSVCRAELPVATSTTSPTPAPTESTATA